MIPKKNDLMPGEHIDESDAALYVDYLLKDDLSSLKSDVLEHAAACPVCKDKILDLFLFLRNPDAATAEGSQGGEIIKFPAAPGRRFFFHKAAAVFVLFALILTAYFLVFKKEPFPGKQSPGITENRIRQRIKESGKTQPQDATGKEEKARETYKIDTSRQDAHDKLPPLEYRVNPNLENMIGNRFRSAAVQVQSPQDNIYLKNDILFSWEDSYPKPLHLKILNNKNEVLFEYSIMESRFVFNEKLGAGLYYWKLESNNDLLYVGKFLVK